MYPNLAGNMGSCCSGALISIIVTLIKPDNEFDWSETKKINPRGRAIDEQLKRGSNPTMDGMPKDNANSETATASGSEKGEKSEAVVGTNSVEDVNEDPAFAVPEDRRPEDYETLKKSLRAATWASIIMSFIIVFVRIPGSYSIWGHCTET